MNSDYLFTSPDFYWEPEQNNLPTEMNGLAQGEGEPRETVAPLSQQSSPLTTAGIAQNHFQSAPAPGLAGSFWTSPTPAPCQAGDPGYAQGAPMGNTGPAPDLWSQPTQHQPPSYGYAQGAILGATGMPFWFGGSAPNYLGASMSDSTPVPPFAANVPTTAASLNPTADPFLFGGSAPNYLEASISNSDPILPSAANIPTIAASPNPTADPFLFGGPAPNYPGASISDSNPILPSAANVLTTAASLNPTAAITQPPAARPSHSPNRRASRRPAQCPHCGKSQATLGQVNRQYSRHIDRSCPKLKFPCDLCGKNLCNKEYMDTHKRQSCPVFRKRHYEALKAQAAQAGQ